MGDLKIWPRLTITFPPVERHERYVRLAHNELPNRIQAMIKMLWQSFRFIQAELNGVSRKLEAVQLMEDIETGEIITGTVLK